MKPRKRTDRYPMKWQLRANGAPITDAAGSTFAVTAKNKATGEVKIAAGACVLYDVPNAKVSYTPVATDVDTSGAYDIEILQTYPDGTPRHFPSDGYELLVIEDTLT